MTDFSVDTALESLADWDRAIDRCLWGETGRLVGPKVFHPGFIADGALVFLSARYPEPVRAIRQVVALCEADYCRFQEDRPIGTVEDLWRALVENSDNLFKLHLHLQTAVAGIEAATQLVNAPLSPTGSSSSPPKMSLEARALAALADHPEWTDGQVAKAAGCSRRSLYRFDRYVRARALLRHSRQDRPRGWKRDGRVDGYASG